MIIQKRCVYYSEASSCFPENQKNGTLKTTSSPMPLSCIFPKTWNALCKKVTHIFQQDLFDQLSQKTYDVSFWPHMANETNSKKFYSSSNPVDLLQTVNSPFLMEWSSRKSHTVSQCLQELGPPSWRRGIARNQFGASNPDRSVQRTTVWVVYSTTSAPAILLIFSHPAGDWIVFKPSWKQWYIYLRFNQQRKRRMLQG